MQAAIPTMARAYSPALPGILHRQSRRRCRNPKVANQGVDERNQIDLDNAARCRNDLVGTTVRAHGMPA
jgi:hypothetical protein